MAYSSKLANNLLYTPFDNKSNVDDFVSSLLTIDEFFDECYVEPDFANEKAYHNLNNDTPEEYDYVSEFGRIKDEMKAHKTEEDNFFTWINDSKNSKVYTISGNAGVGKTTYINGLKYFREGDKNEKWIILNVADSHDKVTWFGDIETHINNFEKSIQKMYATVLAKIKSLFFGYYKNGTYDIYEIFFQLKELCKVYKKYFSKYYQKGRSFFNNIIKIVENYNEVLNESEIENLLDEISHYISNYFITIDNKKNKDSDLFCASLNILIMVLRCKDENQINFKRIILFDNLERFIAFDEIFNEELENIRRDLITYSSDLYDNNNCHKGLIKFVMVMRNSSARMCGAKVHSSDDLASDLNLDDWFVTNLIVDNKATWFKTHNIMNKNIKYLEQITSDLRTCEDSTLTGLSLQINPIFNNNKRLIVDFIGSCIERPSLNKLLNQYDKLWKIDTSVSRFAARSIIRSLIIVELALKDNLFKHLQVYSEKRSVGLGYSRKLLTILYNNDAKEYPLSMLFSEYFYVKDSQTYWKKELSKTDKEIITEILFYMNSYNRRDNDWVQFIDLQIKDSTKNIKINNINSLYSLLDNRLSDFTVTIMPAGEAYLKYMVSSFEYFSFRYYKVYGTEYMPLFSVIPTEKQMEEILNISELPCYKIIDGINKQAIKCIKEMKKDPSFPLKVNHTNDAKSHTIRIIEQHIGYIDKFIEFIKEQCIMENLSKKALKKYEELINYCLKIKRKYNSYREVK
ncbi:MAG: hypothetical protein ACLUFN_02105 [Eubacterium sp.]